MPERLALLGRAPADVRDALATTEAVRAPRRLASGAVGLLRVPETVLEGLRFEETLFFAQQKLEQVDFGQAAPDREAAASAFSAAVEALRRELGPELGAAESGPGSTASVASWVSGPADVILYLTGPRGHPGIRLVVRQRHLHNGDEL